MLWLHGACAPVRGSRDHVPEAREAPGYPEHPKCDETSVKVRGVVRGYLHILGADLMFLVGSSAAEGVNEQIDQLQVTQPRDLVWRKPDCREKAVIHTRKARKPEPMGDRFHRPLADPRTFPGCENPRRHQEPFWTAKLELGKTLLKIPLSSGDCGAEVGGFVRDQRLQEASCGEFPADRNPIGLLHGRSHPARPVSKPDQPHRLGRRCEQSVTACASGAPAEGTRCKESKPLPGEVGYPGRGDRAIETNRRKLGLDPGKPSVVRQDDHIAAARGQVADEAVDGWGRDDPDGAIWIEPKEPGRRKGSDQHNAVTAVPASDGKPCAPEARLLRLRRS